MRRRDLIAASLGAAVATAFAGGVALAAIPGAGGVIQGCYDSGGNVKVVETLPCPKNYTPFQWNQQGLKGDQGDKGLDGAAGQPGAPGANGTNGVDGRTILNGTGSPTTGQGVDGDFYLRTADSTLWGPKSGGLWATGVSLVGPPGTSGLVGHEITSVSVELPPGADAFTVQCPAGKRVLGGGALLTGEGLALQSSYPVQPGTAWGVAVINPTQSSGFVSVYAICASAIGS